MHTPGPWTVFDEKWGIGVTTDCADIAHCGGFDTNRSRDEERANARLIAAAPDLLTALDELAFRAERHGVNAYEARVAIAKARGE